MARRAVGSNSDEPTSSGEIVISEEDLIRGSETVLIADDEPGVRAFVRDVLALCGYQVLEAADGNAPMDHTAGHATKIQLLITDVVLPGIGGRKLATRFRT